MGTSESWRDSGQHTPAPHPNQPRQLLDAAVTTSELMEQLLTSAQSGDITFEPHPGTEILLFSCGGISCALPLTSLREVLPEAPAPVYLPFSPPWMHGIFPLRNELVGLVDPAPVLLGPAASARPAPDTAPSTSMARLALVPPEIPGARPPETAILVGSETRCLAWMVEAVGEIAHAQDEHISQPAEADGIARQIVPRYVAGIYRDADASGAARETVLLRAETLLDDLLVALEEGGDARHG